MVAVYATISLQRSSLWRIEGDERGWIDCSDGKTDDRSNGKI